MELLDMKSTLKSHKIVLLNDGSIVFSKFFGYKSFYKFEIFNTDLNKKSSYKNEKSKV
jgi:hypothetical protein